jgi:murein DD-endopeptidase MepM/ murein hydrolase activator NlpD
MAKSKYTFNLKSLEIEEIGHSFGSKLKKFLIAASVGMVLTTTILIIAYNLFDSPKEKALHRENEHYRLQLDLMNQRIDQLSLVLSDIQKRDDDIYRVIFEAEPVPESEREAGYGGAARYKELQGYENTALLTETSKKLDKLARQLYVQSKSFDKVYELAQKKNEMMASIPAIQPISNKDLTRLASGFGFRIHPVYKSFRMHTGVDFTAPRGTPVYSTGNGKAMRPDKGMTGYGLFVLIDHGYGYKTVYAHLSKVLVKPGQTVKRGEIIGYVGNSGVSTGPHLHYEVRYNNKPVNPVHYFFNDLTPEEYQKVIEISSKVNQALS